MQELGNFSDELELMKWLMKKAEVNGYKLQKAMVLTDARLILAFISISGHMNKPQLHKLEQDTRVH